MTYQKIFWSTQNEMNMEKVLLTLIIFQTLGFAVFGKFESEAPWWRSPLKWSFIIGIVWLVNFYFGELVTFIVLGSLYVLAMIVHITWCRAHGIHPIHATPRRKYFELRGWKWVE